MSGTTKTILTLVAVMFGGWLLFAKILPALLNLFWGVVVPLGIVAGIGYLLYHAVSRKSLGAGDRRTLP